MSDKDDRKQSHSRDRHFEPSRRKHDVDDRTRRRHDRRHDHDWSRERHRGQRSRQEYRSRRHSPSRSLSSSERDTESRSGHREERSSRKREKNDRRRSRKSKKSKRSSRSRHCVRESRSGRREERSSRKREKDDRRRSRKSKKSKRSSRSRCRGRSSSSSSLSEEDCKSPRAPTSSEQDRESRSGRKGRKSEKHDRGQMRKRDSASWSPTRQTVNKSSSGSKETLTPTIKVESKLQVGGDVNKACKDQHSNLRRVIAHIINYGQIYSTQEGCTSNVTGASNVQQPPSSENSVGNQYGKRRKLLPIEEKFKTINEYMWNHVNTAIKVFQTENVTEPKFKVYPQIAESPNFYKGHHTIEIRPGEGGDNAGTTQGSNSRRNEYIKEEMFQFETCSKTKSVSFETVMQEISKKPQPGSYEQLPVFGLFAQAGAGKTTFMRHWAKQVMMKTGMSPENDYLSPAHSRFQLLLYCDLKDLKFQDTSKSTTVQELLFGDLVQDTRQVCKWLMQNQSKVILFFDGLDQAPWQITEKNATGIGPEQKANIPTIIYNLLSRNVLKKSSIVLSSREFRAASLPYKARPQKVYTLTGFSSEDAKSLFNTLVSPKHENQSEDQCEVISNIKEEEHPQNDDETPYEKFTKTLSFQHFLTIPMFLTFAALVYKSFKGYIPNSVTALLAKVLELLRRSDNTQERENIWKIISKLKVLAHEGMTKGSVVFTNNDLDIHGFKINDACDLLLMVPGENTLSQRFLEGDFQLFFCHQIIQEFLSACYIVELSLERFSKFVEEDLHEQRWSVVRRFVCGLLFLKSINGNLVRITDKEGKKKKIYESLVRRLSITIDDLELFASIYESNDDQLIQSIKKIDLLWQVFTREAAHMISSLMAKTGQLEKVSFSFLNDELLNVMSANLENVKVGVATIELRNSRFSANAFNNFFQNIDSDEIEVAVNASLDFSHQEGINWENIRCLRLKESCVITFLNNQNSVEVCVEDDDDGTKVCSGIFDKKNETLVFDCDLSEYCCILLCQMLTSVWLSSKSIPISIKAVCAQYLEYADLHFMEKLKSHVKVDEIVLNAIYISDEDDESTVRDKILSLVRLFKVQILNIAIALESLRHFPLQLEHDVSATGCELKIYVYEVVEEAADLQTLISTLRESQVQYFRLRMWNEIEVEDLISFIKSCNVTKQLVIISNFGPSDIEKQMLKDAAESLQINLAFEERKGHDSRDAWAYVF